MVLTQRHPSAHGLHDTIARIQPSRVLGLAGAITLNATALMLLLVPVSAPVLADLVDPKPPVLIFIEPAKPKPPLPEPVPVEAPKPRPSQPTQAARVQPQTQTIAQTEAPPVDNGTEYVPPADPVRDIGPVGPPDVGPQISTRLEYASAPAPSYPSEALARGLEGTVLLKVFVDVDGSPLSVEIERSSGHRKLDDAARRQVLRKWKFRPAIRDGQAIQVYGIVPVSFTLTRG